MEYFDWSAEGGDTDKKIDEWINMSAPIRYGCDRFEKDIFSFFIEFYLR